MSIETISEQRSFGGVQGTYRHTSITCGGPMRFAVYLPPQAQHGKAPILYFLAGLTCSEETFFIKSGAQRLAAEFGIILVAPDTSPRNTGIANESVDWEVGTAAGFYVDATQAPWSGFFNMYSYVTSELPRIIAAHFPADEACESIFGHSMGGHGTWNIGVTFPDRFAAIGPSAGWISSNQPRRRPNRSRKRNGTC